MQMQIKLVWVSTLDLLIVQVDCFTFADNILVYQRRFKIQQADGFGELGQQV